MVTYAVIESGGKQLRVAENDTVKVDLIDAQIGSEVSFNALLISDDVMNINVGKPYTGKTITGVVVSHGKADKVNILKFRRRKHHMKKAGHRQQYTEIRVGKILDEIQYEDDLNGA